jgi:glycosyltransferase involved in cell wall biosynthesis
VQGDRVRVVFAIPELDAGGPDRVVFELIRGLARDRFEPVLVVGRAGGGYFNQLPDDVRVEVIGGGRYPVMRLARAVRRLRPDVLFTTLRMNLTAAAARPFLPRKLRRVARLANQFSEDFAHLKRTSLVKHRLAEAVTRWALSRPDAVVCQSQAMKEDLEQVLGRGAPPLIVIGNPIDLELVAARAAQAQAPPAGDPRLLAVGRLATQKGFDVLICALPAVIERHPDAVLTILGEGEERAALEALAAGLGLGDAVRLPGLSPNPYPAMAQADLLVSSSRYEGFANVIVEAMAAGCPVVATDCPGATREMVIEGVTGWLAAPDDPASLAAAILRALAADREPVARAAAGFCREHYAPERILAAYERVLAPQALAADAAS